MTDWPEGAAAAPEELADAMSTGISLALTNTRLEFADVAPVVDDLARRSGSVSVSRNNPANPLMGGGVIDVAIALVIVMTGAGAVEYGRTMGRLLAEGIVIEDADGMLRTLPPAEAAAHIDRKWDLFLDELPDIGAGEGTEMVDTPLAGQT